MMKRRKALTSLGTGMGALFVLPAWATNWNRSSLGADSFLNAVDSDLLSAIVDTIIPATATPGAKELGVPSLIQKLVYDCQPKQAQDNLSYGLMITNAVAIGEFGQSFTDLTVDQRLVVLKKMATSEYPDQKNFLNSIKRMTIDGYMRSEYAMTNITKFEFAPNRYYGCVPVKL